MAVFLTVLSIITAIPGDGAFELGAILGEPTGISLKYWTGASTALDGAVSWSLRTGRGDWLYIHWDYLWHNFHLIKDESVDIPLYYGIGGRTVLGGGDTWLGLRFPVGLSWLLNGAPLDIFLELAGVINLVPGTDFDINGGLGIRYVF